MSDYGHNQVSFDAVVEENLRRGLLLTIKDLFIQASRDKRFSPRHFRVLAEVVDVLRHDGVAAPGRKSLATATADAFLGEPGYSEATVGSTIADLISWGYLVSDMRQQAHGGRPVSHYTIQKPSVEELQREISDWVAKQRNKKRPRSPHWEPRSVDARLNVKTRSVDARINVETTKSAPESTLLPPVNVYACLNVNAPSLYSEFNKSIVDSTTTVESRIGKEGDVGSLFAADAAPPTSQPSQEVGQAFALFVAMASRCALPVPERLTDKRKTALRVRLREYGLDGWQRALANIERSPFLRGDNNRGWRVDLDWLLTSGKFSKVVEGGYVGGNSLGTPTPTSPMTAAGEPVVTAQDRKDLAALGAERYAAYKRQEREGMH